MAKTSGPFWLAVFILANTWFLVSCAEQQQSSEDQVGQSSAVTEQKATAAPAAREKSHFEAPAAGEKEIQARFDAIEKGIQELGARAATLEGEARSALEREVQGLEEQKKAVRNTLNQLQFGPPKEWTEAAAQADAAVQDLDRAYRDVLSGLQ